MFASSVEFTQALLAAPTGDARLQLINRYPDLIDDAAAECIKQAVESAIHANLQEAIELVNLLETAAKVSGSELHRALSLLAKGNVHNIGMAEYVTAIEYYDLALEIYGTLGHEIGIGRVKLGRLWALSCLGRYEEAFVDGEDSLHILRSAQQWKLLAITMINLSAVHQRNGSDESALGWLEQAALIVKNHLPENHELLSWINQNQAISLRNAGRFEESTQASLSALARMKLLGQPIEAARAQQNLAMTYYLLGRYNEALINLEDAYMVFVADHRWANALVVELYKTDCLLQLRRFEDVIEICQRALQQFREMGLEQLTGEVLVNQATARTKRGEYDLAIPVLSEAMAIFEKLNQPLWIAIVQLDLALVYQSTGEFRRCIDYAIAATDEFQQRQFPSKEADAWLVAAATALQSGELVNAERWIKKAVEIGQAKELPFTIFQCHRLSGQLLELQDKQVEAMIAYDRAITELEKLRSTLMLEHRPNFLADKGSVYEAVVHLCLEQDNNEQALDYAERAKSSALVELLDRRLDLKIRARRPEDQTLVEELQQLRTERDRLQNGVMNTHLTSLRESNADTIQPSYVQLVAIEKKLTSTWHKLLTYNADYAWEANLLSTHSVSIQEYLPENTILVEYFVMKGKLVAFVVGSNSIVAYQLPGTWYEIQKLLQKWQLSIQSMFQNPLQRAAKLIGNARGILLRLYQSLIAPLAHNLKTKRLIIVPHGSLHYAPFHAFFDGQNYLVEQFEISYLPSASLLRLIQAKESKNKEILVYGNSCQLSLPNIASEAHAIARSLKTKPYLDGELSKSELMDAMQWANIIHLATHGQFHPENPIFSGLQLEDGWLTTLDVFNLQLDASLVTLSGCNTGRNHILGGDEVSGLMRAFLSAGARSLILSLWPVEDSSSAWFMEHFYGLRQQNIPTSTALRQAQLACIREEVPDHINPALLSHPFFWAPFFLVGNS